MISCTVSWEAERGSVVRIGRCHWTFPSGAGGSQRYTVCRGGWRRGSCRAECCWKESSAQRCSARSMRHRDWTVRCCFFLLDMCLLMWRALNWTNECLNQGTNDLDQAKPNQSSNWGRRLAFLRKSTSPCLLAIPAFDRIAGLYNRHLNSNRGICLR